MEAVKIRTSWRIKLPSGDLVGWYMTQEQAERGIAKRLREQTKSA